VQLSGEDLSRYSYKIESLGLRNVRIIAITKQVMSELECGPIPNVKAALPNIGGALCSTPQSLADAHY